MCVHFRLLHFTGAETRRVHICPHLGGVVSVMKPDSSKAGGTDVGRTDADALDDTLLSHGI